MVSGEVWPKHGADCTSSYLALSNPVARGSLCPRRISDMISAWSGRRMTKVPDLEA